MAELTLDAAAMLSRAHAALLKDLRKLKAFIASPNPEIMDLLDRLDVTTTRMAEHFRLEEKDGYMESVRVRSPHLERAVDKLKCEHAELLITAKELLSDAQTAMRIDNGLRARVLDLIAAVRDHEERENILIEDVYNRETGLED